jgi:hypothetical protein
MSAIFDNASSITQSNNLSVMSASTISGKRVSQRRGAYLYTFSVSLNKMPTSSSAYKNIRKEIALMDYGVNPLSTAIPVLTKDGGSWLGAAIVAGASQTGRNVILSGFTASTSDAILDGDFIQFSNNGKVYQAMGDYASDVSGNVTVKLNSPLITPPINASSVIHGTSVVFSLAIDKAEFSMSFTPRSATDNFASANTFEFTEVIT